MLTTKRTKKINASHSTKNTLTQVSLNKPLKFFIKTHQQKQYESYKDCTKLSYKLFLKTSTHTRGSNHSETKPVKVNLRRSEATIPVYTVYKGKVTGQGRVETCDLNTPWLFTTQHRTLIHSS